MVLSFALVYPDSFPAESTCVQFLVGNSVNCAVVVAQHSVYCARVDPAHQVLVFPFPCCVSSSCARDCVFLTRDVACTTA